MSLENTNLKDLPVTDTVIRQFFVRNEPVRGIWVGYQVHNSAQAFAFRLCGVDSITKLPVPGQHTAWYRGHESIVTFNYMGCCFAGATSYWDLTLPTGEPFMVTTGLSPKAA